MGNGGWEMGACDSGTGVRYNYRANGTFPGEYIVMSLGVLGGVRGFLRGLARELGLAIGILLALLAGWHSYQPFGDWLSEATRLSGRPAYATAFVLSLVAAAVALLVIRLAVRAVTEFRFKGPVERVGGLVAGLFATPQAQQ